MTASPSYEMRFSVSLGRTRVRFVRRPVSFPPADGTYCLTDDGDARGWRNGQSPSLFRNGEWTNCKGKPLRFVPTFWTDLDR